MSPPAPFRLALLLALLASFASSQARAFCRATTAKRQASCFEPCVTEGFPLAWADPSVRYVFNERGFPGLDEASLRAEFDRAFQQWEDVTCDGEPVGLSIHAEPGWTALRPRADRDHYRTNVFGHLSGEEWAESDLDPRAFALTIGRFDPHSGELLGGDMWFNGGMGSFEVCPEMGCESPRTVDLPNVVTHEAGHFLGLAHSPVEGATMECSASAEDTDKRTLEQDDRAGLCAIYPPGTAFASSYIGGKWAPLRRSSGRSCSLRPAERANESWAWLAVLSVALFYRRALTRRLAADGAAADAGETTNRRS
jgi:hypothetical protein